MSKLRIRKSKNPSVTINRCAINGENKIVYIACANIKIQYGPDRSCIVYIGKTVYGPYRIAHSAVEKAHDLLNDHGVTDLHFYKVEIIGRQSAKNLSRLERGLLITFRERYGKPPICNRQGKFMKWTDEKRYYTEHGLKSVLERYSNPSKKG